MLPDLLNQIPADEAIGSITTDGAFDTREYHNAIPDRGANAVIPSAKTPSRGRLFLRVPDPEARPGELRNTSAARSGETGLDITGYYRRGRIETKMHCAKLLDQWLMARDFDQQGL